MEKRNLLMNDRKKEGNKGKKRKENTCSNVCEGTQHPKKGCKM